MDGTLWTVVSIDPIGVGSETPASVHTNVAALVTVSHGGRRVVLRVEKPLHQLHLGDVQLALVRELAIDG